MKKIFFALAALVLAFTGCSQEEDAIQVSEKKAVKVVVNMDKPGFGEDTRAARTGWEAGDVVGIILNDDFNHVLYLTYSGTTWEPESFFLTEVGPGMKVYTYDEDDEGNPTPAHEAQKAAYFSNINPSGNLKAIYCSSGLSYFDPIFEDDELVGTQYLSIASEDGIGECIMTCDNGDNGTYTVSEGVLTLEITMKPQVAQFTIKDLEEGEDGKTSEDYEVGVAGGNLITFAGGTITTEGIVLEPLVHLDGYNACWVHPNADGISIYASVDPETNEFGADDTYTFMIGDDFSRDFNCNTYKSRIYNGAAIIMGGPYTVGAEGWY